MHVSCNRTNASGEDPGLKDKDIATSLDIAHRTVKRTCQRLVEKRLEKALERESCQQFKRIGIGW